LAIRQQGEDGSARVWPQLFEIALVYEDHTKVLTVNMNASSVQLTAAAGEKIPRSILFNSSGQGYGVFPIDEGILRRLPSLKDPVMRASAYINSYENMLDGRGITPRRLLDLDRAALAGETEALNLNILLDQITSVYWRYLSVSERDSLAPDLENGLWQTLLAAGAGDLKKLLFRTYTNIVVSGQGVGRLYTIWKDQQPPAGVKLSEEDYTGLAAALSLRGYPDQELILQEQLSRIQNTDRRQRLLFLLPALSSDTAERDKFFDALKVAAGRKKEAWVLTGLSYLHHPLRTAYSEKYLPQTLALLEEVQRTGDVFFPQGWLGATLSWYRTRTAATTVRNFLRDHPDYNPKLKAKLLQAADYLLR
jgi:aminopeptidase N